MKKRWKRVFLGAGALVVGFFIMIVGPSLATSKRSNKRPPAVTYVSVIRIKNEYLKLL